MSGKPAVTIVLSTYNRPDTLRVTIHSVLMQSITDWRLLVIGDCCDERTLDVVASFSDKRIFYINLPFRCGEQALPNSIGMALVETEYIALLNHDDILLQDHLAIALKPLQEKRADLFVGLAAFSRYSKPLPDGSRMPVFSEANPTKRSLRDVFTQGYELFEPCSTWLFHRAVFEKIGSWRPSAELYRTPIEDWLLRAWRGGVRLIQPTAISVLRMLTHYQQGAGVDAYSWKHDEHSKIEQILLERSPAQIRQLIAAELRSEEAGAIKKVGFGNLMTRTGPEDEWLAKRLITSEMADVFLRTGWDSYEQFCVLIGRDKGSYLNFISNRRTGEAPPPTPDFNLLLDFARSKIMLSGG